ncbi:hypothetical protein C1T17_15755 [Sphingobium sp. SCG-1]|nr:hypothetical protein C1T17_15755 [Sphingobium sp. SCG-1]
MFILHQASDFAWSLALAVAKPSHYEAGIRKDPVRFRVAIPAADPPDNVCRSAPPVCCRSAPCDNHRFST